MIFLYSLITFIIYEVILYFVIFNCTDFLDFAYLIFYIFTIVSYFTLTYIISIDENFDLKKYNCINAFLGIVGNILLMFPVFSIYDEYFRKTCSDDMFCGLDGFGQLFGVIEFSSIPIVILILYGIYYLIKKATSSKKKK